MPELVMKLTFTSVWNCYLKIQTMPNLAMKMRKYRHKNSVSQTVWEGRGGEGMVSTSTTCLPTSLKMMLGCGNLIINDELIYQMLKFYTSYSNVSDEFHSKFTLSR